jgi:beta-galactosidase
MYAERQGYHYPSPPDSKWKKSNPVKDGLSHAGVGFYTASFRLRIPSGWDVPMSVVFGNSSQINSGDGRDNYRCQLFINGYQFGKYSESASSHGSMVPNTQPTNLNVNFSVNKLGPQNTFPVPEGILNHEGENFIALTVWAQDRLGAALGGLELVPTSAIKSGYSRPPPAPQPTWVRRSGAY